MTVHFCPLSAGGIGLLIKLLKHGDADIQAAAVHALSVVTTTNDYNCRSAALLNLVYDEFLCILNFGPVFDPCCSCSAFMSAFLHNIAPLRLEISPPCC